MIRQIEKVQVARWAKAFDPEGSERILFPDLTLDLVEENNELSFWRVTNVDNELIRVAVATSVLKQSLKNYSVIVLSESKLKESGFSIEDQDGVTVDADINKQHVNVKLQSAANIVELGMLILQHGEIKTITANEIERAILEQLIQRKFAAGHASFKMSERELLHRFIDGIAKKLPAI